MTIKKREGILETKERMISPNLRPERKKVIKRNNFSNLMAGFTKNDPHLQDELKMAEMDKTPEEFMAMVIQSTLMTTFMIIIVATILLFAFRAEFLILIPIFIVTLLFTYKFFRYTPKLMAKQRERKIDKDIVFAGRHLVIALRSGVPLFDAMVGLTQDYDEISVEFNKIVERITLGEPSAQAIRNVGRYNPSKYFNRLSLQIVNALSSGADLASSLDSVLDQIAQEQIIALKEYGQKLNPLSMFYMLFAIVFPSLGVVFITVLIAFTGGGLASLGAGIIVVAAAYITFSQFLFITMVESSRPPYELA